MSIENLSYLKESPMFQLSLISKELFHSNFISWIIFNYKDECSKVFSRFLTDDKKQVITHVKREEKNRDLVIYFEDENGNKSTIVIENKVKSIPTYEQLRRYTTNESTQHYILLSLVKPTFLEKDNKIKIYEVDREWGYLSYGDLAELLEEIVTKIEEKNSYHSTIVNDYIQLAKCLDSLTNEIYERTKNGAYDLYEKENKLINSLREIRLHDFYLKLNHEVIAGEIHTRIKEELPDVNLVPNKNWKDSVPKEIITASGFTRGSGITDAKYVIGEKYGSPIIMGIQIQGVQFRLFIETKKGFALKFAQKLYENRLWFDFSTITNLGIADNKEYPQVKKEASKNFNTYSNEFFYRSVKLNNCEIKELIDSVMYYIHFIHREQANILSIIDEIEI